MSISDLYCLVSNFDASPKSINEAMNFKLPVITRNTVGTAGDLVINGFNGYIINDNISLGKTLKKLITNKNKLNYFSQNSYVTLDNFFHMKFVLKMLLISANEFRKVFETPNNENYFFGYYDVPQLCSKNLNLITVKVENIYEIPSAKNEYEIFCFNIKTGKKKLIGKTKH